MFKIKDLRHFLGCNEMKGIKKGCNEMKGIKKGSNGRKTH
jgi:hypothetical protein